MKLSYVFTLLFLSTFIATSDLAFAHGEDKPGPNGGAIRMPGAFHTEVVPEKNGFKVILIDLNFQNPMTKDSGVKASIQSSEKNISLKCETKQTYFFCDAPNTLMKEKGTLEILPTRHKAQGALVTYPLPLAIPKEIKK